MAKGHSSFNKFVSLDASPVTGTSFGASGPPSDLVTEAFLDPSFVSQVRGLEAMLRVRERIRPAAVETDSHGLSSELAVVAGSGKIDKELGKVSESAFRCPPLDAAAGNGGHDAVAASGLGDVGVAPALHRCSMDPEIDEELGTVSESALRCPPQLAMKRFLLRLLLDWVTLGLNLLLRPG